MPAPRAPPGVTITAVAVAFAVDGPAWAMDAATRAAALAASSNPATFLQLPQSEVCYLLDRDARQIGGVGGVGRALDALARDFPSLIHRQSSGHTDFGIYGCGHRGALPRGIGLFMLGKLTAQFTCGIEAANQAAV